MLLNQAPHVVDRYAWWCGMPQFVSAFCDTTVHRIEVEDTATAILRHADRIHGLIHVSTIESPPMARAELLFDRGRLTIEGNQLKLHRLSHSLRDQTADRQRQHATDEIRAPAFDR